MQVQCTCRQCGAAFTPKGFGVKRGYGVFCSQACYRATPTPLTDRFWAKVDKHGPLPVHRPGLGPCWIWTGAIDGSGYGKISRGRRGAGLARASRVSWEIHFGPLDGANVLHKCDVRRCVRPDHLFLGTIADNQQDAQRKGRLVGAGKGVIHYRARLTEDDVREIRRRFDTGEAIKTIVPDYPLGYVGVWYVARRKTWTHIK